MPSRWHRFIERLLPWYDPETEAQRNARTEAIRQRAIKARIDAEQVRADYARAARRFQR